MKHPFFELEVALFHNGIIFYDVKTVSLDNLLEKKTSKHDILTFDSIKSKTGYIIRDLGPFFKLKKSGY